MGPLQLPPGTMNAGRVHPALDGYPITPRAHEALTEAMQRAASEQRCFLLCREIDSAEKAEELLVKLVAETARCLDPQRTPEQIIDRSTIAIDEWAVRQAVTLVDEYQQDGFLTRKDLYSASEIWAATRAFWQLPYNDCASRTPPLFLQVPRPPLPDAIIAGIRALYGEPTITQATPPDTDRE